MFKKLNCLRCILSMHLYSLMNYSFKRVKLRLCMRRVHCEGAHSLSWPAPSWR